MKKIYLLLSIVVFGLVACENELNQIPISEMSSESFFRNETDFSQAVNSIYSSLKNYPERQFHLSEVRSDNIYGVGSMGVRSHEPVNNFALTLATNEYMAEAWNANYAGVLRANTVLDKITPDALPDAAKLDQFEGEARFLRALFYFDMVKIFGPLPIIDHLVSPNEALEIQRSPVADVYNLIISDLEIAIQKLPKSYGAKEIGRATSYAAKGLLARVYLTRSGPVLNPNGPCMDSKEYDKALSLLNDVIAGPYSMLADYAKIFDLKNENNAEMVFDIQYSSGGFGVGAAYPGEFCGSSFWRAAGVSFAIGLENKDVSKEMIDSYGPEDKRFASNIQLGYIDASSGKFTEDPACIKFCKPDPTTWGVDRFDFPTNFPVIRITDILMMKAECILQGAAGSKTEVDKIVNDVRARAGLTPLTNVTLDQLMDERRKEFLSEGFRWHDLVRTGKVLDVMNVWIPKENVDGQMATSINANHIIYPVPQAQLDVKKGLYQQNPGY